MAHHRRVLSAALGFSLLAGTAGAAATAGASSVAVAHAPATSEQFSLTETISLQGQHLAVTIAGVASPTLADLHITAAGTAIELRRVGGTVYVHVPPGVKTGLPAGKTWGSLSLASISKQLGQLGVAVPGLSAAGHGATGLGVGTLLSQLAKLSTSPPRKVGAATIHGIAATAYQITIDPSKVFGGLGASASATVKQLLGSILGMKALSLTLWADAAGQVVQIHAALPLNLSFAGAKIKGGIDLLMQGWNFGVPVHVAAPPAAQVAPIPLSALGSAAGGISGLGGLG